MAITRWKDVRHKFTAERHEAIKRAAREEFDRLNYAGIRKARHVTQVELAKRLGTTQSGVAGIELRSDAQLSTLSRYIHALGGELQLLAVFPEATFDVELPEQPQIIPTRNRMRSKSSPKAAKHSLAKAG